MFTIKKEDQPHAIDPDQVSDGAVGSEPSLEAEELRAEMTAGVSSLNLAQRMGGGSNSSPASEIPAAQEVPTEVFERAATRSNQSASVHADSSPADVVHAEADQPQQPFEQVDDESALAPEQPAQPSQPEESIQQFGLPVDPSQTSPKIGAILAANGKMTDDQINSVLEMQQREPSARFGELAVRARIVSQKDVDDALATQFGFSTGSQVTHNLPSEIVTAHTPFSPFAEALRGLRSQLMLRWFDGSPQQCALAMTSVDRADGKSFICSNLGVIFSQLGERTLIIDADLRNSTQHLKFGLPNKMGLSGMLSGRAGVEEILAVPGMDKLAVLPAGPIPPNPQELLGREDFSQFLAAMSNTFDVILIDTPSAQQASDAQVIAQRARAALIVGRKDKTKTSEIGQLGAVMTSAGVKLLGATLNQY